MEVNRAVKPGRYLRVVGFARAASMARVSRLSSSLPLAGWAAAAIRRSSAAWQSDCVAFLAESAELVELLGAHDPVVNLEHLNVILACDQVFVDADHRLSARVDPGLVAGRGLLRPQLADAILDRARHAPDGFDLRDMRPGLWGKRIGEALDVGAPSPGVDNLSLGLRYAWCLVRLWFARRRCSAAIPLAEAISQLIRGLWLADWIQLDGTREWTWSGGSLNIGNALGTSCPVRPTTK
jgi:hypothetical protein